MIDAEIAWFSYPLTRPIIGNIMRKRKTNSQKIANNKWSDVYFGVG